MRVAFTFGSMSTRWSADAEGSTRRYRHDRGFVSACSEGDSGDGMTPIQVPRLRRVIRASDL